MKRCLTSLAGIFLLGISVYAQNSGKQITQRLADYFASYQTTYTTSTDRCRIENVKVDEKGRTVEIFMNEVFAGQSFSRDKVQDVYRNVKRLLPTPYNAYRIIIYGKKIPVEELVTDIQHGDSARNKKWGERLYRGIPWVKRAQLPYDITQGLQDRHLAVWASHGRYYKNDKNIWTWQRLICTALRKTSSHRPSWCLS